MNCSTLLKAAIAAGFLSPMVAGATNGYFSHGFGAKTQGMAGAGIAFPQDALAAATNPAGMVLVGNRADLGVTLFAPIRGAEISGSPVPGLNGGYGGNGRKYFLIPDGGYVRQLSETMAVGVSVYGNGGIMSSFKNKNPYGAFGSTGTAGVDLGQLFIAPSAAWKVTPEHAIGVAINFVYQRFSAFGLQAFDNPVFSSHPGSVTNRGKNGSTGWGLRLGWTGQITPELTLGATWSPKIRMTNFDRYKGLFVKGGNFDVPENYGVGLAYRWSPATTVALDVQRINFADVATVGTPIGNPILTPLGSGNGSGFGWKNADIVKMGVNHGLSGDLSLRAGVDLVGRVVPDDQALFNIIAPGVIQNHLSLGATWLIGNGELNLAYTRAFKTTVGGKGALNGFGGGSVAIHLEEDIFAISWGWKL